MVQRRGSGGGGVPNRGPSAAGGSSGNLTGRDLVRALRKRWLMIVVVVIVFTILAAVGTQLWLMYAPLYRASAQLGINPPQSAFRSTPNILPPNATELLVRSHMQRVKAPDTLRRASESAEFMKTAYYKRDPKNVIQHLEEDINVSAIPTTNIIEIWFRGIGRDEAERTEMATIVNAVANAFLEESRESLGVQRNEDVARLENELRDRVRVRDRVRADIQDMRRRDVASLRERGSALEVQIQMLARELTQLKLERAQAQAQVDTLEQQGRDGTLTAAPEVVQMLEMDQQLRSLSYQRLQLKSGLANAERTLGPQHRQVQAMRSQLDSITAQIDDRERVVIQQALAFMVSQRQGQLASIMARLDEVRTNYDLLEQERRTLSVDLGMLDQLLGQDTELSERIEVLDNRLTELRMLAEQNVHLQQLAVAPREPDQPRWSMTLPVGVMMGLLVGLGLAFLLEFMDTSVKTPTDVTRRIDLPLLGIIPHAEDIDEQIDDVRLAFKTHPNSVVSEAFRQIRTCLLFSGPASQRRSLLVTSPLPHDGRTTVALNLAATIARSGRRVLVVDTNFRQAMVRKLCPSCDEGGLSAALSGQADWREMVSELEPNMFTMAAGPMPANPAELLGGPQMRQTLDEMMSEYDQVLLDGAPCLVVTDAPILSTLVDGVVLVVRAGENTYGIVQRARDTLLHVGAHVTGVTLNGVKVTAGGYLRENYETFYEYHIDRKALPAEST
jgi:capsular exopolysaccharide synthesis family protein